jgi:hypothetical protein
VDKIGTNRKLNVLHVLVNMNVYDVHVHALAQEPLRQVGCDSRKCPALDTPDEYGDSQDSPTLLHAIPSRLALTPAGGVVVLACAEVRRIFDRSDRRMGQSDICTGAGEPALRV